MKKSPYSIIICLFIVAIFLFFFSDYIQITKMREIAKVLGSSLLSVVVGLLFVNLYFENLMKRHSIGALFQYVHPEIADFHNALIQAGWNKYGKGKWGDLLDEYVAEKRNPKVLNAQDKDFLCKLANDRKIQSSLELLNQALFECMSLSSWNLDDIVLAACLDARRAMKNLKTCLSAGGVQNTEKIAEAMLDVFLGASFVYERLKNKSGIEKQ